MDQEHENDANSIMEYVLGIGTNEYDDDIYVLCQRDVHTRLNFHGLCKKSSVNYDDLRSEELWFLSCQEWRRVTMFLSWGCHCLQLGCHCKTLFMNYYNSLAQSHCNYMSSIWRDVITPVRASCMEFYGSIHVNFKIYRVFLTILVRECKEYPVFLFKLQD